MTQNQQAVQTAQPQNTLVTNFQAAEKGVNAILSAGDHLVVLKDQGKDPRSFGAQMIACLKRNTSLLGDPKLNHNDLKEAMRRCVVDGLLPDGKQAAIFPGDGKTATYRVMKEGYQLLLHRATGAIITSGHVKEGDEFDYTYDFVWDPDEKDESGSPKKKWRVELHHKKVISTEKKDGDDKRAVLYAWCLIEFSTDYKRFPKNKDIAPVLVVFDVDDINAASAASKTTSNDRAWTVQRGKMAEKSVVGSAVRRVNYLITDTMYGQTSLGEDDFAYAEDGREIRDVSESAEIVSETDAPEVVDAEYTEVEDAEAPPQQDGAPPPQQEDSHAEEQPPQENASTEAGAPQEASPQQNATENPPAQTGEQKPKPQGNPLKKPDASANSLENGDNAEKGVDPDDPFGQ